MNTTLEVIAVVVVAACATGLGVVALVRGVSTDAIAAMLGVLVGSGITGLFQVFVAEADRRHALRTAALERRLQAHQQAYALWRKLIWAPKEGQEFSDLITYCNTWWQDNCLYLTPAARRAFYRAINAIADHTRLVASHEDAKYVSEAWEDFEKAGNVIVAGVDLPPIGASETMRLGEHGMGAQDKGRSTRAKKGD